jgi:hypothetical protein
MTMGVPDDDEIHDADPNDMAVEFFNLITSVTVSAITVFFAKRRMGDSSTLNRLELLDVVDCLDVEDSTGEIPLPRFREAIAEHLDMVIKAIDLGLTHGEGT